jgi:hypothetical protein
MRDVSTQLMVPASRRYIHSTCGTWTELPESTRRGCLADPDFEDDHLKGEWIHCDGCADDVHLSEVIWTDTGQSLWDWLRDRRASLPWNVRLARQLASSWGLAALGALLLGVYSRNPAGVILGAVMGCLIGWMYGAGLRRWLTRALRPSEAHSA